jgi:hypothetical protein
MIEHLVFGQLPLGFENAESVFGMSYSRANFLENYQCNACYQKSDCQIRSENSKAAANNYPYFNEAFSFLRFDIPYVGESYNGIPSGESHLVCREFDSVDSMLQLEFDFDKKNQTRVKIHPVVRHLQDLLLAGKLTKTKRFNWILSSRI